MIDQARFVYADALGDDLYTRSQTRDRVLNAAIVKADISREMELEELRKLQSQVQSAARDIEQSMHSAAREVESGVRSVETQLNEAASAAPAKDESPPQPPSAEGGSKPEGPARENVAGDASRQATLPGFEHI